MTTPTTLEIYQHRYGGIYQVREPNVINTDDMSIWVVYSHVWPFDLATFVRPFEEFTDGRFRHITQDEMAELCARDRTEFQELIEHNRKISKR